jgi:multiple sugar transport system permease protein
VNPTPLARLVAYTWLVLCTLVFLCPIAWMVLQSLKTPIEAIAVPPRFVFAPTLANYVSVLGSIGFRGAMLGSLIIGMGSVAIALLTGVPFAYALARCDFPGRKELGHFILSTKMLPAVVIIVPFTQVYRRVGLLDTYPGVIIAHVLLSLAVVVWVMRGFFQALPRELEEAAVIDGASRLRAFGAIVLPLAIPGLITVAALGFILSWNDLFFALTLTSLNVTTLPAFLGTQYVGFLAVDWGKLSAAGLLSTLPIMILAVGLQRFLIRGLALGAVK